MPKTRTMKMMRATKPFRYQHRMLAVGDMFEIDSRFAKVLRVTRKAVEVREPAVVPPPPPAVAEKIAAAVAPAPGGDVAALRAEYESVVGRRPFMGWDEASLRDRIAAARTAGG